MRDESLPPATDTAGASVAVASPTAATFGVPVGYPQSPAGVRAAAVAWVSSLGELLQMGPIARDEALAGAAVAAGVRARRSRSSAPSGTGSATSSDGTCRRRCGATPR